MTASADELSPTKRALIEIRQLRAQVAELQRLRNNPIAIVGASVRAPGAVRDLDGLEHLLWAGVDAITEIPADRWAIDAWYDPDQNAPGKMNTRYGGFIDEVAEFDAEFFGISPREAESMDPQQRLALELAWHALEDSGRAPGALAGKRVGIYLGIGNGDYGRALFRDAEQINPYFSSGTAFSVAAGRVSYSLGLVGPSIAIDTACSSSLVAVHLACQALRLGECDLAIAGGVNLMLTPEIHINFSKAGMLSRSGRCRTFDAAADGYVRGEGGGMVVLRGLQEAQSDGDRVLAVVAGSAVNQDGRSNGLTAPNGPSQEAVIRAALRAADVPPARVGYVEAHGTGTSLGDPIELNALGAVLAEGRDPLSPAMIGSIKTNIGHLEAAAGVLGLIKCLLVLRKGEVPPQLHLNEPNPLVDWDALPLKLVREVTPWPQTHAPRLAAVSSFGFSGTNAHVLLEAPPEPTPRLAPGTASERPLQLLVLSARTAEALRQTATLYEARLRVLKGRQDFADLCSTANKGRTHFAHRLAVVGADPVEIADALTAFTRGEARPQYMTGLVEGGAPRVAFLFPGQGPQHVGMGRDLYDSAPVFRDMLDRVAAALDPLMPEPILPIMFGGPGATGSLDDTVFAQPAMFALEVALVALWRSFGIEPVVSLGHSLGEFAAAWTAGAVSLEDAARLVAARGRLTHGLPGGGAMAVAEASEDELRAIFEEVEGRIDVAAVNGARNTVISGETRVVEAVTATLTARGRRIKPLRVSHAFHSPLLDSVLDAFESEAAKATFRDPASTLISTSCAQVADLALIGRPRYWRDHMREPVRFFEAMATLGRQDVSHLLEVGPHPVLLGMIDDFGSGVERLASLREGDEPWSQILASLSTLYCAGASIDWSGLDKGRSPRKVAAPLYPFQRRRHWTDTSGVGPSAANSWESLVGAMDLQAERGPFNLNPSSYPAKWLCLRRLTDAYAVKTLRDGGLFAKSGERRDLDAVMCGIGAGPVYRRLVQRWLDRMMDAGLLDRQADVLVAPRPLAPPPLDELWAEAEALFADNRPLFDYVRHCGSLLGDVLAGRESPLETLFPGGSFDLARGLYEQSTTMLYVNQLARAGIEAGVARADGLRVLEIGAGTGGTTSSLLDALPADRVRYVFTDVSDVFLAQAEERFADRPFMEFARFDLDQDLESQGRRAGEFDVIVAANAVHAVKDLRAALARLRELLAPGGVLLLIESTEHLAYFDMTTGLIEGWQHFADDLRGDDPLLPAGEWTALLNDAGFAEARAWPAEGSPAAVLGQHVIAARAPGQTSASVRARIEPSEGGRVAAAIEVEPGGRDWIAAIAEAFGGERMELLRELAREQVVRVLRLPPSSPPSRHDRLMDIGMDSLMAVQLRDRLSRILKLDPPLPSTLMFDYPTIEAMASYLGERLQPTVPDRRIVADMAAPVRPAPAPSVSEAELSGMSDNDVEVLLMQRLAAQKS